MIAARKQEDRLITDKQVILAGFTDSINKTQKQEVASMKMSFLDRIQATQNSKVYQKDYQRYVTQREKDGEIDAELGEPWDPCRIQSMAGKRLCEKWGLNRPIAPDAPFKLLDYVTMTPSAEDCPEWMIEGVVYPVSFPTEDELKKLVKITGLSGQKSLINGKLCLLIDTSWPLDMIMDVLRKFIEHYSKKTKERKGIPMENPWEIYLLHKKGMNFLEITKMLHGVSSQPAIDKISDSYYRRVRRAYSKALEMIDSVEKEAEKRERLPKY